MLDSPHGSQNFYKKRGKVIRESPCGCFTILRRMLSHTFLSPVEETFHCHEHCDCKHPLADPTYNGWGELK